VQVAAVAVAILTDLEQGSTELLVPAAGSPLGFSKGHMRAIDAIETERLRQENKWGTRTNRPIAEWLVILGEEYGEACQAALEEVMFPE
jgi:hypothetical protein